MNVDELQRLVDEKKPQIDRLLEQIRRVIVGQDYMIDRILIGLLANGHILLEGVPGLAKTLSVSTVAACIQASFHRIQFTPDLLPADLTGTMIYRQKTGEFEVAQGPIFANFILADEINRAPSKVQSALLEAMQERQVTIGRQTFPLSSPFLVMATQNPLEQEGTYPLPEAQQDRFMLKLKVEYPSRTEEKEILRRMVRGGDIPVQPVITPTEVLQQRELVKEIKMEDKLEEYILDIVFATREPLKYRNLQKLENWIECGASPRATIYLAQAAKASAFLQGRAYVIPDDIKLIGHDVLRHRIILTYEAEAEEITQDQIVTMILEEVEVP